MSADFETVQNYHEEAVFRMVEQRAERVPLLMDNAELAADVACIALNRLPPRYIRSRVDMSFFLDEKERVQNDAAVRAAVDYAVHFVQSRAVSGTRG